MADSVNKSIAPKGEEPGPSRPVAQSPSGNARTADQILMDLAWNAFKRANAQLITPSEEAARKEYFTNFWANMVPAHKQTFCDRYGLTMGGSGVKNEPVQRSSPSTSRGGTGTGGAARTVGYGGMNRQETRKPLSMKATKKKIVKEDDSSEEEEFEDDWKSGEEEEEEEENVEEEEEEEEIKPIPKPTKAELAALKSELTSTAVEVGKGEKTVAAAMGIWRKKMMKMTSGEIAKCFYEALEKLPESKSWEEMQSKMAITQENDKIKEIVPEGEKKLFEFLIAMQNKEPTGLAKVFDDFLTASCPMLLFDYVRMGKTTPKVARLIASYFFALSLTKKDQIEKAKKAREMFHKILINSSSEIVVQTLVFMLCNSQSAFLASEILKTESDDEEFRGRLISMHMNAKESEVLDWAVDQFADDSCNTSWNAAFRTHANLTMVQDWWDSDMEILENAREHQDFFYCWGGTVEFDPLHQSLVERMPKLLSAKASIEGLDRVKLMAQLDIPSIDVIDQATASDSLSESEGRVVILKVNIAIRVLQAFNAYRKFFVNEREALRLHLKSSMEKVDSILKRDICQPALRKSFARKDESYLNLAILDIKKWETVAKNYMGNTE